MDSCRTPVSPPISIGWIRSSCAPYFSGAQMRINCPSRFYTLVPTSQTQSLFCVKFQVPNKRELYVSNCLGGIEESRKVSWVPLRIECPLREPVVLSDQTKKKPSQPLDPMAGQRGCRPNQAIKQTKKSSNQRNQAIKKSKKSRNQEIMKSSNQEIKEIKQSRNQRNQEIKQ